MKIKNIKFIKKRKISLKKINFYEIKENSLKYEKYLGNGIVKEFKEPICVNYQPLKDMLNKPKFCEYIFDENKNLNLRVAFMMIHKYYEIYKKITDKYYVIMVDE